MDHSSLPPMLLSEPRALQPAVPLVRNSGGRGQIREDENGTGSYGRRHLVERGEILEGVNMTPPEWAGETRPTASGAGCLPCAIP